MYKYENYKESFLASTNENMLFEPSGLATSSGRYNFFLLLELKTIKNSALAK